MSNKNEMVIKAARDICQHPDFDTAPMGLGALLDKLAIAVDALDRETKSSSTIETALEEAHRKIERLEAELHEE